MPTGRLGAAAVAVDPDFPARRRIGKLRACSRTAANREQAASLALRVAARGAGRRRRYKRDAMGPLRWIKKRSNQRKSRVVAKEDDEKPSAVRCDSDGAR